MPELPEVETIKLGLDNKILNKEINKVWIEQSFSKKVSPNINVFRKSVVRKKIKKVWRRARLLIFDLSNDLYLIVHLKMTGQLVYRPAGDGLVFGGHPISKVKELPSKFTRVIFYFKDSSVLFFNDIRKFGFLKIVDDSGLAVELDKYGLEPLDKEFNLKHFENILSLRPGMKIKQFLLEQKLISGIGNIYADEALFASKIKSTRTVGSLTKEEGKILLQQVKRILKKAIKLKGTSFSNYVNSDGDVGGFQNHLKVYGRANKECVHCKELLKKIKLGGRTATYCPVCQK